MIFAHYRCPEATMVTDEHLLIPSILCRPIMPREQVDISYLPRELVDMILEHLGGDTSALQQSSLVCSQWLETCQKLLFKEFSVSGHTGLRGYRSFYQCIPSSPRWANYIRTLHLRDYSQLSSDWHRRVPVPWMSPCKLRGILSHLPNIRILTLNQSALTADNAEEKGPLSTTTFTLEEVRLSGVYFQGSSGGDLQASGQRGFLNFLTSFSEISKLYLEKVDFRIEWDRLVHVHPHSLHVRYLHIEQCDNPMVAATVRMAVDRSTTQFSCQSIQCETATSNQQVLEHMPM